MAVRPAVITTSDPARRRATLPSLTGIRFIAALLVFLAHSTMLFNPLQPTASFTFFEDPGVAKALADFFDSAGNIGVSFFFVLSGFVLTWSSTPGERITGFWRRRALKIYPNHIVTWALAMLLFASATPLHAWLPNLFLVHAFSNRVDTVQSVNFPSWSLCSELLFYALFPLFIVLVRRIADSRLWLWAGTMAAGVAGVSVVTRYIPGHARLPGLELTVNQQWFSYAFPPPRLFEFVLGMILARIVIAGMWPRIGLPTSVALFAAGYYGAILAPAPYSFSLTTIVPIGMVICAAASADLRGEGRWLGGRVMVWLGNVSFAFYLVQVLVIFYGRPELLDGRTFGTTGALALLIVLFAVNLLAAWLLYSLVEKPVMRRWSRGGKRQPAHPAPERTTRGTDHVPAGETV
ncbi:acyltransferase family protein [Streptomyces mutabilis]|uniref:acyltransferase family protein n=1 Tax=Streptomyces mutabilis TaxID=67332 RepID=UPI001781DC9D|nr:acyltransferase [Streptomyces mutabilis]GGQ49507.1 acyltransferase [Streptomyces mutabilis]